MVQRQTVYGLRVFRLLVLKAQRDLKVLLELKGFKD